MSSYLITYRTLNITLVGVGREVEQPFILGNDCPNLPMSELDGIATFTVDLSIRTLTERGRSQTSGTFEAGQTAEMQPAKPSHNFLGLKNLKK